MSQEECPYVSSETGRNVLTRDTSNNKTNDKVTSSTMTETHAGNVDGSSKTRQDEGDSGKRKPGHLFHSVSIIVEPVYDDDELTSNIPLVLTPTEIQPGSDPLQPSPQSPILDYDDFMFENQRKKSQEEDEIVQTIMANARLRKEEFARLLEEHAQLVNEINRAETTLL